MTSSSEPTTSADQTIRGPDGRTWWIPPAHVDPHRTPRSNWFHHPDGYLRE